MHLSVFPLKKMNSPNNVKIRRIIAHLRLTNNIMFPTQPFKYNAWIKSTICLPYNIDNFKQSHDWYDITQAYSIHVIHPENGFILQANWCLYIDQSSLFIEKYLKATHEQE